jgi:hypothetical protein
VVAVFDRGDWATVATARTGTGRGIRGGSNKTRIGSRLCPDDFCRVKSLLSTYERCQMASHPSRVDGIAMPNA